MEGEPSHDSGRPQGISESSIVVAQPMSRHAHPVSIDSAAARSNRWRIGMGLERRPKIGRSVVVDLHKLQRDQTDHEQACDHAKRAEYARR